MSKKRKEQWKRCCLLGIAFLMMGCSSPSKFGELSFLQKKANVPPEVSFTPGSAELSNKKKLTNPVAVHLACGIWHEQEGRYFDARSSFEKVLEKNPKHVDANLGIARLDVQQKRFNDAMDRLEKTNKLYPKDPKVAAAFGQLYGAQERWDEALTHMQRAKELSPYDPTYAYQLGIVQARAGQESAALASLTESTNEVDGHYNLAVILNDMGRTESAKVHLEKALSLKPGMPLAERLLASMRDQNSGRSALASTTSIPNSGSMNSSKVQPAGFLSTIE